MPRLKRVRTQSSQDGNLPHQRRQTSPSAGLPLCIGLCLKELTLRAFACAVLPETTAEFSEEGSHFSEHGLAGVAFVNSIHVAQGDRGAPTSRGLRISSLQLNSQSATDALSRNCAWRARSSPPRTCPGQNRLIDGTAPRIMEQIRS